MTIAVSRLPENDESGIPRLRDIEARKLATCYSKSMRSTLKKKEPRKQDIDAIFHTPWWKIFNNEPNLRSG
jgi:hypothetical protein